MGKVLLLGHMTVMSILFVLGLTDVVVPRVRVLSHYADHVTLLLLDSRSPRIRYEFRIVGVRLPCFGS